MRIVKKILVAVVLLIILLLIVALFLKKDYRVERDVVIKKPKNEVYNYVKFLKNQDNFSKWATMDPNMKKSYTGIDGTPGFVSAWEGNSDVGRGAQEIKKLNDGASIDYEIRFVKPFASVAQAEMKTVPVDPASTKVSWSFTGHMPYPMNIMRILGMENMIGKDLQTGLDKLKTVLER